MNFAKFNLKFICSENLLLNDGQEDISNGCKTCNNIDCEELSKKEKGICKGNKHTLENHQWLNVRKIFCNKFKFWIGPQNKNASFFFILIFF